MTEIAAAVTPTSVSAELPVPVFRQRELARLDARLQDRRPAFVAICGEAGMGKTTLLRALRERALVRGWRVAPAAPDDEFGVRPTTTEETFCEEVRAMLGGAGDESPDGGIDSLIEQLCNVAPVLVLVDGYRTQPAFAGWFVRTFMERVRGTGESIVVAIAEQPGDVNGLSKAVDQKLSLRPLNRQPIRRYLGSIAQTINPPLEDGEINTYVEETRYHPDVLDSLVRVLRLMQQ